MNVDVEQQGGLSRAEGGLSHHREHDPAFRAGHAEPPVDAAGGRGVRRPSSPPTASWVFTWSATAPASAYRARTRPPSYIHFAVFPYLIVGHQISDVVAVLGSLNIIAAELDR